MHCMSFWIKHLQDAFTLKIAGLFQRIVGSDMDKPMDKVVKIYLEI